MAASASSVYTPHVSLTFSHKSSTTFPLKTLNFPIQKCKSHQLLPTLGLSLTSSHPIPFTASGIRNKWVFRSYSSADDASSAQIEDIENDMEVSENEVESKSLPSLETVISAYKEAILAGDEKTISDTEAMFYALENQKNELDQKVSMLSADITSGKEKYIRLQADFDNFRKRSDKERLSVRSDAQGEIIESLLPMVDNFERAKQHIKTETESEQKIDASYQGIYKQFVEIMRSLNVSVVATVGKPFDPALHEAIAREESEEYKEGFIVEEFRRGFVLGDRLIRPAMVKVSAGPGAKQASADSDTAADQPTAAAAVDEH